MLPVIQLSNSSHTFPFTTKKTFRSKLGRNRPTGLPERSRSRDFHSLFILAAVKKDSEFEVDPVQAREALRKLDEQLQSIATKPESTPKIKASDINLGRLVEQEAESEKQLSGSFLATLATALVLFTIFYNILFITVIKPSIDGPSTYENINFDDVELLQNTAPTQ
ncbi:OLC1v1016630C1 [Oldenlandia corymbosa var. corymbosa]|uniref:OLC1v1016630C1 n=1 Tax=Oldenlandia corymbosa var. corymbosa TaxID=529605 RepID=A0AAV1E7K6_OLDCO|nr:OLC1v1016630C1 [Oldenlandia corymbosa var. corymbosa]